MSKILQSNLCLNPDTGDFEVVRIESTISLDKNNNYIRSDDGSEKSLVDLGYIIENVDTAIFHINDILLTKRFIEFAEELKNIEIAKSEICIITNDNNFKSVICVVSENILSSNTLTFNVDSYSSTVRASVLEDMNTIKLNTISETENIKNIAITEITDTKVKAIEETNNIKTTSITEINNIKTDSIASINEIKDEAQSVVENIKTVSVAEISNTKTEAISETENIKTLAIEEITNVAQTFKDYVASLGDILAKVENKVDDEIFIGMVFDYAGDINELPSEYVLAQGQEVSRTGGYAKIFKRLGVIWGAGNGSTTFNLLDGRAAVSKGAGQSSADKYPPYKGKSIIENRGAVGSYQGTAGINIIGEWGSGGNGINAGILGMISSGSFEKGAASSSHFAREPSGSTVSNHVRLNSSLTNPTGKTNRDNNFAVHKVIYIGG